MDQEPIIIEASLILSGETIPVEASYSSKFSLWVRFPDSRSFMDGQEFSQLIIRIKGENIDLGSCRLISEANIEGYAGRLIFIRDIYDVESLLYDHEVVKLQSAFLNLPLVLPYKDRISQAFKNYTADLTYDLCLYKGQFDAVDAEHRDEPENIRKMIQKAIMYTEGQRFFHYLDERLAELEDLVADFSPEEHERHGFYFRKQLFNYILSSKFMARTNLKPRGYSGDSEMMTMLYQNDYQGDSTFEKLMHKHPCEHPAAQAVRNRRRLVTRYLRELGEKAHLSPENRLRILSVACGTAAEIDDILLVAEDCCKYRFTLFDQDRQALLDSADMIYQKEKDQNTKINVEYLNESVRTMLAASSLKGKWGQYDFIYSMGLFDYLTPPVAKAVLGKMYELLAPGGEMIIGNFHVSNPSKVYMEYWLDWVLYYRTEKDFLELVPDTTPSEADVFFEETKSQMFLKVKKLA